MPVIGVATIPAGADNDTCLSVFAHSVGKQTIRFGAAGVYVDHRDLASGTGHGGQAISVGKFQGYLLTRTQTHACVIADKRLPPVSIRCGVRKGG